MAKSFLQAIRIFLVLTLVTGVIYPLTVTAIGLGLMPNLAGGSLVERLGTVVGSTLIAQKFVSPRYFHPRPSAVDFATVASGASNLGPTSRTLKDAVESRVHDLGPGSPPELVLASASGLDPHISPESARFQLERVMAARGLPLERRTEIEALVAAHTESPTFGILGTLRVNVLALNLDLDRHLP